MERYHVTSVQSCSSRRAECWLLSSGFGVESGKAQFSALPPKADIERHDWHVRFLPIGDIASRYSNAKIRFQSFFMLMTVQPSFFASS